MNGYSMAEIGDKDMQLAPIVMTSGFKFSGRFVIEGNVRSGNSGNISYPRLGSLIRDPEVGGMFFGFPEFNPTPAADGSFTVDGIPPGNFRVLLQADAPG